MHSTLATRETTSPPAPTANVRTFAALLWRRKAVMVLVVLLVGVTVAIGLASAEKQYTAVARVAATPPQGGPDSAANYVDLLGTLADVAESRPVLEEVSDAIGDRSLKQLQERVRGSVVTGTVLIQVSVTDPSPVEAAQIANAVVAALPAHDPSAGSFVFNTTEPAAVPTSFTSPDIKVTVLAGALLAIAAAVAAAVVYDKVARTVESPEEAAGATGAGVLGVVTRPQDTAAVPATDPNSPEFASLRALRVALEFASSDNPTRTLVVAPVVGDPWSGWLEVNLAVALADVGHRVLLVDANRGDRRRHPVLDAPTAPGLYDLLAGVVTLEDAITPGPVDGVSVVPLGNPDLAAPSLLEMRFRRLLEDIDAKYDVILIHAAPVTESDDARVMAIDGGMLLTVPWGRVKRRVLERAAVELAEVRIRIVGAVLLGARRRGRR